MDWNKLPTGDALMIDCNAAVLVALASWLEKSLLGLRREISFSVSTMPCAILAMERPLYKELDSTSAPREVSREATTALDTTSQIKPVSPGLPKHFRLVVAAVEHEKTMTISPTGS